MITAFYSWWLKWKINFRKADDWWVCCGTCHNATLIFHHKFWCRKYNIDIPDQLIGTICDWHKGSEVCND